MPDKLARPITPTILADFMRRCHYGAFTLDVAESDEDGTTFSGEISLDQLADTINEHFGYFPTARHKIGACNGDDGCYFCRKAKNTQETANA